MYLVLAPKSKYHYNGFKPKSQCHLKCLDFAVWLVNSVLYLPEGQVKLFGNSTEIPPRHFPKIVYLVQWCYTEPKQY